MEFGHIIVLRNGKATPPYKLDEGEHTIGSSEQSNIRLKFSNPLLLKTHAIIRVSENGVATIVNKSTGAPIKVNNKIAFKPTILRHGDTFLILDRQFCYFNENLKDVSENAEILTKEKRKILASSRKSVMPLSKTPAKSPTYKTKVSTAKTPSQRLLNKSLGTLTKHVNKSLSTPMGKSLNKIHTRRSVMTELQKKSTPLVKMPQNLPKKILGLSKASPKMVTNKLGTPQRSVTNSKIEKSFKEASDSSTQKDVSQLKHEDSSNLGTLSSENVLEVNQTLSIPNVSSRTSKRFSKGHKYKTATTSSEEHIEQIDKGSRSSQYDINIKDPDDRHNTSSNQDSSSSVLSEDSTTDEDKNISNAKILQISKKYDSSIVNLSISKCSRSSRGGKIVESNLSLTDSEKSFALNRSSNKVNESGYLQNILSISSRRFSRRSTAVIGARNSSVSKNCNTAIEDIENESRETIPIRGEINNMDKSLDVSRMSLKYTTSTGGDIGYETDTGHVFISENFSNDESGRAPMSSFRNNSLSNVYHTSPSNVPGNLEQGLSQEKVLKLSTRKSKSTNISNKKSKNVSNIFVDNCTPNDIGSDIVSNTSSNLSSKVENRQTSEFYESSNTSKLSRTSNVSVKNDMNNSSYSEKKSNDSVRNISLRSKKSEQSSNTSENAQTSSLQASTIQNSRETTIDTHQNNSEDLSDSASFKRKSSKQIISTFDESTQDNNLNVFTNKSEQRKSTFEESTKEVLPNLSNEVSSRRISILDTEEILSPVKPLTRRSTRTSQDSSSVNVSERSSVRRSLKSQMSENSSLTVRSLEHSSGSVISISSQSFSSFKKVDSKIVTVEDDTEIDVVNITASTGTPEIRSTRLSTRIIKTPNEEERLIKRPSVTAQMFEDVNCTSTPFHKPHISKKNQELTSTSKTLRKSLNQSGVLVISSTNVTVKSPKFEKSRRNSSTHLEVAKEVSKRRSNRNSISRNKDHDCISCKNSSVKRSRSVSASNNISHGSASTGGSYNETSPAKMISSSVSSKTETPLILHRKSNISSVSENTPEKLASTEDETPKSHVKPTRRSSRANQSAYNPVLEDITPVTPEKLQVSDVTEEMFKTPVNTPGLFESIRKSAIKSRKRHRESNGSILKDNKRARVDFDQKENSSQTPELQTATIPKTQQKSPLNRLSNFEGVKKLMKTPPKSPKNDLRNIPNLRRIMSPKVQKSPKNDLTAPYGIKKLLASPKKQKLPVNDLTNVSGVANVFNISGVEVLHQGSDIENSEDLFTQLTGKRPVKAYSRSKTLSPTKEDLKGEADVSRKSMGDLPLCSPRVQQWVEEHAYYNYKNKNKPTVINADNFKHMSHKPVRRSKVGRSLSSKKVLHEKKDRRNTMGNTLRGSPNITEWKIQRSVDNLSEEQHNTPKNTPDKHVNESDLENISDEPRMVLRIGRSISPKKTIQANVNRRKTYGDNLRHTPDVSQWKSKTSNNNSPRVQMIEAKQTPKIQITGEDTNIIEKPSRKSNISTPVQILKKSVAKTEIVASRENTLLVKTVSPAADATKKIISENEKSNDTIKVNTPSYQATQTPIKILKRSARRNKVLSVEDTDLVPEATSSPALKVQRKKNKRPPEELEIDEILLEKEVTPSDIPQKRTRTRRGNPQSENIVFTEEKEIVTKTRTRRQDYKDPKNDEFIVGTKAKKGKAEDINSNELHESRVTPHITNGGRAIPKTDDPATEPIKSPEILVDTANIKKTTRSKRNNVKAMELETSEITVKTEEIKTTRSRKHLKIVEETLEGATEAEGIKSVKSKRNDKKVTETPEVAVETEVTTTRRGRNRNIKGVLETPETAVESIETKKATRSRTRRNAIIEVSSTPENKYQSVNKKIEPSDDVESEETAMESVETKKATRSRTRKNANIEVPSTPENKYQSVNKKIEPSDQVETEETAMELVKTKKTVRSRTRRNANIENTFQDVDKKMDPSYQVEIEDDEMIETKMTTRAKDKTKTDVVAPLKKGRQTRKKNKNESSEILEEKEKASEEQTKKEKVSSRAKRHNNRNKSSNQIESDSEQQSNPEITTNVKSRKVKDESRKENEEHYVNDVEGAKPLRSRSRRNIQKVDTENSISDDVTFSKQTRPLKVNTTSNESKSTSRAVRKTRRGAVVAESEEESPAPNVPMTRRNTKKQKEQSVQIKTKENEVTKPKNEITEDVEPSEVASRTTRAKRQMKKKSADSYELADTGGRSKRRIRFEDEESVVDGQTTKKTRF